MPRLLILLFCVAIVVQGRPRHHKHKKAYAAIQENEESSPQAYQQPLDDKAPTGPPQNINVYNMQVHKMGNNNKVTGQLDAHNVAVSMQGPGTIDLSTTPQLVAAGEPKPDHTISVVKDTQNSRAVRVMNVHSGHELPVVLPLSEPSAPKPAPKAAQPEDQEPSTEPQQPAKLHTEPREKAGSHEQQHTLKKHAQGHSAEQQASHEPSVHLHHNMNKEVANNVLKNLESTLPVVTDKPKHEISVTNGHKIKLTNEGKPQRVFGQVDSNNVAITMQGPGSTSVTSNLPQASHTIVFDPFLCPGKSCPQNNGHKRHKN